MPRGVLPQHVSDIVSSHPELMDPDSDLDDLAVRLLRPQRHLLRIVVGPAHLAIAASHALGDARSMNRLLTELLTQPVPDLSIVVGRTRTSDVLRLVSGTYVRRPGTLVRAWGQRRSSRAGDPGSGARASSSASTGRRPRVLHRRVDRRQVESLRRWRDRTGSSASTAALAFTAWFRALDRLSADLPDGFWVLVDTRRYGPPSRSSVWGNYAQSVRARPAMLLDPEEVGRALRSMVESTWPLAALALSGVKGGAARQRTASSTSGPGGTEYYMSYLPGTAATDNWPWSGPEDTRSFVTASTPAGPSGVTVQFRESSGDLHITISCTVDAPGANTLSSALTLMTDPLALLDP